MRGGELWLLENLDRVNRALQSSCKLEQAANAALEALLDVFVCDRARLVYPCDPDAPPLTVLERTRPEHSGAAASGIEYPTPHELAARLRLLLATEGPVQFGPEAHEQPTGGDTSASEIAIALHPRVGRPWLLALQHCGAPHVWSADEERLVREVGPRLTDALTNLLAFRELRDSEDRLLAAARIAQVGHWERDLLTDEVKYSAETRRIFGVPPDLTEISLEELADRLHPDDRRLMLEAFERATSGESRYDVEYRVVLTDGEVRVLHSQGDLTRAEDGRPVRMFGSIQDITERKRAEEALALFRSLIDRTEDMIEVLDAESGRFLDVNETACRVHGYTREEYLGLTVMDIAPALVDWDKALARLRRENPLFGQDSHRRKDGSTFPIELNSSLISLDREYVVAVYRDVSERKQAERALLESHNLLRSVVDGASDTIYVKDLAGRYLLINTAGAAALRLSPAEVVGKDDWALLEPQSARAVRRYDEETLAAGEPRTFEETSLADGTTRTYLATRTPYRDPDGNVLGLIGIARDVTELKRLEDQLRQSQKMEAVGRLAGGVAHDFNNLLTVINGHSALVFEDLDDDDLHREPLAEILRATERAAGLTRQLLAFSRKQVLQPRVVSVNTLLGELTRMLERLIGENIKLELALDPELGSSLIDPGQFEQAIVNLVVNARDAMPAGGRLRIDTRSDTDEPGVIVTVSDTGQGMDEATAARVFEPFFTTRSEGTGLGLAMVYGFVTQSGGRVDANTTLGEGTTFTIWLPHAGDGAVSTATAPEAATIPDGTETVLLVEDEDAVRSLARVVLQSYGYTVLAAADGDEAIPLATEHDGPIHLLVSDVVLPRMGGPELAGILMRDRPEIRVLFMSGYTDEAMLHLGALRSDVPLLQKPFDPISLARRVREVLDRAG